MRCDQLRKKTENCFHSRTTTVKVLYAVAMKEEKINKPGANNRVTRMRTLLFL